MPGASRIAAIAAFLIQPALAGAGEPPRLPPPLAAGPAMMAFAPASPPPPVLEPTIPLARPEAPQELGLDVAGGIRLGAGFDAEEGRRPRPRLGLGLSLPAGWNADVRLSGRPGLRVTLERAF
jgi:hypothetical protein